MDDLPAIPESGGRGEPRWLTPADLLMLTVGFALAFSLRRIYHLDDPFIQIGAQNIPRPEWQSYFLISREVAMKCGLIVVPAITARRIRYGGLPHPAEWLAILAALPWAHDAVEHSGAIQRLARWYLVDLPTWLGSSVDVSHRRRFSNNGIPFGDLIDPRYVGFPTTFHPGGERPLWCAFNAIVLVGLLTALRLGRRRIPDWATTALLSAAAFAGLEVMLDDLIPNAVSRTSGAISGWLRPSPTAVLLIANGLQAFADGLLLAVPFAVGLSALRSGTGTCRAWTAWAGATVALVALAAELGHSMTPSQWAPDPYPWTQCALLSVRLLVAGLAAGIIVVRLGRSGPISN